MEELADKDTSPLKDSEISRLIDVSNNAGYKKQEAIPNRNLIDFIPKSLLEIALKEEHVETNKEKKIEPQPNSADNQDDLAEENHPSKAERSEGAKDSEDKTSELIEAEDSEPIDSQEPNEDISKPSSQDMINQQETENQSKENTSDGTFENHTEIDQALKKNELETKKNEVDPLTAAKQEGIEIGKKMANTLEENNLIEASKTLHSVIESLKGKDVLDKTKLMNSILSVITDIACERAGQIIDKHPKSFTEKILSFIDDIDKSSKKVILNLNPYDAKLIGSSILEHFSENELKDLFRSF